MDQKLLFELSGQIGKIPDPKRPDRQHRRILLGGDCWAMSLTGVSGSSTYYIGGVIAYSNTVKESQLGVSHDTLMQFGAVSHQTAREMAAGVRERLGAAIGLSTTGIAGPTGGTPEKPVGLVYIGISTQETHRIL